MIPIDGVIPAEYLAPSSFLIHPEQGPRHGAPAATPPNPIDPVTTFRYPLGMQDPDNLTTGPHVRAELGLEQGLGHFHLGTQLGRGHPGGSEVKAPTLSSRDLSL